MTAKLVFLKDSAPSLKKQSGKRKPKRAAKVLKRSTAPKSSKTKRAVIASSKGEPRTQGLKIVVDINGRRYTLKTLDARSASFGQEFGAAFKKSVKKARRENSRVIGQPDIAVAK